MNKAKDLLRQRSKDVWTVSPEVTVYEALEVMAQKNVGTLPVLADDKLIGIFSERDYARKGVLMGRPSRETLVRELMNSPVVTIDADFGIYECPELMTEQRGEIRDLEGYITGTIHTR